MKACIVGAGAVGGLIGARLARDGHQVSAFARGATLDSLRLHGFRVIEALQDAPHTAPVFATDETRELGIQELVVVAVKAPALRAIADAVVPMLGPDTIVLCAMNGVPWWFFASGRRALRAAGLGRSAWRRA